MRDDFTTGIPEEPRLPMMPKIQSLIRQDVALAEGRRMQGFAARQAAVGFRQPAMFTRTPEVALGSFLDFGS